MEKIPKTQSLSRQLLLAHNVTNNHHPLSKEEIRKGSNPQDSRELDLPAQEWRGKNLLHKAEDLMPDVMSFRVSIDSLEDAGSTSFHGASHPAEPLDSDLMRPVYVPIGQNNGDGKYLVKSLSIRVPNMKPSPSMLSPAGSLAEEPDDSAAVTEEKECIWDVSLPPSSNASPHSSIDSIGFATAMSIVNSSASTYHSDGMMSDGMKGSIRGDSLGSTKTSLSRASDSSGLSDDSNWSNATGSANKPHKGNDPRWKAILSVQSRDGILGMSQFRLLKRLGCGDVGSVYLSKLCATRCFFAMKVMDKASLASRNKLARAHTEREILQLLDHPFLPTLYTHFETDRFSCLVMEYCPGGDLYTLRQRQLGNFFSEYAARCVDSLPLLMQYTYF